MLFKWPLFCFRPCSSSSPATGREIQHEKAAGPACENVGSIYDDKGGCKDEEETKSSANRSRKSFSIFAIERGFLKWEPEAASAVQEAKHLMTVNSKVTAEEKIIRGGNPGEGPVDDEVMDEAAGNGKENVKEDNILYCQEPPSFRIYCLHHVSVDGDSNEGISEPGSGKKKKRKIQDCMTKCFKGNVLIGECSIFPDLGSNIWVNHHYLLAPTPPSLSVAAVLLLFGRRFDQYVVQIYASNLPENHLFTRKTRSQDLPSWKAAIW
ncbi:hypothetical protein OIU77_016387 [Salix suchowensis]|uniref:Uncharacterized protein n=1 Tax=Salix suchowensis TaxID=1278906 RepID=A0ABQ8ZKA6_9ROSI|nr:hypothetical protein OIU77_016387 [Salix suchowensis]